MENCDELDKEYAVALRRNSRCYYAGITGKIYWECNSIAIDLRRSTYPDQHGPMYKLAL